MAIENAAALADAKPELKKIRERHKKAMHRLRPGGRMPLSEIAGILSPFAMAA